MVWCLAMVEIACPQCNYTKDIPFERIPPGIRWVRCPKCGGRFKYLKREEGLKTEKRQATPWETHLQLGLWRGIKETIKSVNFLPRKMFSTMPVIGGLRGPLAFGLLIGSISSMFSFFWEFLMATSGFLKPLGDVSVSFSLPIIFFSLILLSPILVTIEIFILSFIIHFLLLLVRCGKNRFEATFRVVAYSQATRVWSIIPFIGSPIGWVWRSIIHVIGLKEAHETSYLRVMIAFSIPLVVLLLIVASAFFFIIHLIRP
jgi:hypothetical protein